MLVSGVLQALHVRTYLDPAATSFCTVSGTLDCTAVTLSRFSVFLGVPLPAWGALGGYAMFVAAWRRSVLILPLSAIAALGSVLLFLEELVHVGAFCLFCEAVHLACLLTFVFAWRARAGLRRPATREDAIAVLGIPALLWAIVRAFVPPYWVAVLWLGDVPFPTGVDDQGRPWIGAENPELTVVEYTDYACPHCRIGSSRMRMKLAEHPDELRIVRGQQPRMRCVASRLSCQFLRAAVCAGDQDKFWQMDSWLFAHAPDSGIKVDLAAAAHDVGLDAAELERCFADPTTMERAEVLGRGARDAKIRETPAYVIDGEKLSPSEMADVLADRL
jgi:uncharacterized membrane protein/predicted DsbA family dithiol-disulfide isomerase